MAVTRSVSLASLRSLSARTAPSSAVCVRRTFTTYFLRPHDSASTRLSYTTHSQPSASVRITRRSFASQPGGDPPKATTICVSQPTEADIEEAELDVELVPPEQATVELTDRAAEQLKAIAIRQKNDAAALRVAVESGGCHGYQYKLELATERAPEDYHFAHPTITPSNLYVDAVSLTLLKGSTVDFSVELIGSSFRILDNPQSKGSGCGCGVSWELNDLETLKP